MGTVSVVRLKSININTYPFYLKSNFKKTDLPMGLLTLKHFSDHIWSFKFVFLARFSFFPHFSCPAIFLCHFDDLSLASDLNLLPG